MRDVEATGIKLEDEPKQKISPCITASAVSIVAVGVILVILGLAGALSNGSTVSTSEVNTQARACTASTCVTKQVFFKEPTFTRSDCENNALSNYNGQEICSLYYANVALFDKSGNEVGDLQLMGSKQYRDPTTYSVEKDNYQFIEGSGYPAFFSIVYPFTGIWELGSQHNMNSVAASIDNKIYVLYQTASSIDKMSILTMTYDTADFVPDSALNNYQQVYYDKKEFVSWVVDCTPETASTCLIETYNAPLYNTTNHVVGNVLFWDYLSKTGEHLWVAEYAMLHFFRPMNNMLKYVSYVYDFESATGNSVWPPGYSLNVRGQSSSKWIDNVIPRKQSLNYPVNDELVVFGDKRYITLKSSDTAPSYTMINEKTLYYTKNDFPGHSAANPCQKGKANCTVEIYNGRLYTDQSDPDNSVVGNVNWFDVLQYDNKGNLAVTETGAFQFTASGYPSYFVYQYGFESDTGNSVWPSGYKVQTNSISTSFDIDHGNVYLDLTINAVDRKAVIQW